jgi:hypothetical protein
MAAKPLQNKESKKEIKKGTQRERKREILKERK